MIRECKPCKAVGIVRLAVLTMGQDTLPVCLDCFNAFLSSGMTALQKALRDFDRLGDAGDA